MGVVRIIPRGRGNANHKDKPSTLRKLLNYTVKDAKVTLGDERLVSSWNCDDDPEAAFSYMRATQKLYGQEKEKWLYVHMVQSFPNDQNISPELAHEIGVKFIESLPEQFNGYEILMGTHMDTDTLHNQYVINRTNCESGRRWHQNMKDLRALVGTSIELCKENGIEIKWKLEKDLFATKNMKDYKAHESGISWKDEMKKTMFYVMNHSSNKWDFMTNMKSFGYRVNWWDDRDSITIVNPHFFKCNSKRLFSDWDQEYIQSCFDTYNQSFPDGEQSGAKYSEFGQKKALTKNFGILQDLVYDAAFLATSEDEFKDILTSNNVDTIWKDDRKHISFNYENKTYRLSTLTQRNKWDKDTLLTQFGDNLAWSQRHNDNPNNTNWEKLEYEALFSFTNTESRLIASFNHVMKSATSTDEVFDCLNKLGFNIDKEQDSFQISFGNDPPIPLERIPRHHKTDRWDLNKVKETLGRNDYCAKYFPAQIYKERRQLRGTIKRASALGSRLFGNEASGNGGLLSGRKLEGQALKELAIKLSSTSGMNWDEDFER